MARIRGERVTLYSKTKTGVDGFGKPVWEYVPEVVENVLIGQPTSEEIVDELNLSGKRLEYVLAIPKGDTHIWTDRKVSFWGKTFQTFGEVTRGIEDNIPLSWNKKVKVARYE